MSSSGTFTTALASDKFSVNDESSYDITSNNIQPIPAIQTIAIQGQMVTATMEMRPYEMEILDEVQLKTRLINQLCMELLSTKCIEFTKQQNLGMDTVTVRARIYATPDNQVRLIRNATK